MEKFFGKITDFAHVRKEKGRTAVCYGLERVGDGNHCTWYEVYLNKKGCTLSDVKKAVCDGIDAQTREQIVSGFVWEGKPVRLSIERQLNLKEIYDLSVQTEGGNLPIKVKLGNDAEGLPVYRTFRSVSSLADFYRQSVAYKQQCLEEGWKRKDTIDWSLYEREL